MLALCLRIVDFQLWTRDIVTEQNEVRNKADPGIIAGDGSARRKRAQNRAYCTHLEELVHGPSRRHYDSSELRKVQHAGKKKAKVSDYETFHDGAWAWLWWRPITV